MPQGQLIYPDRAPLRNPDLFQTAPVPRKAHQPAASAGDRSWRQPERPGARQSVIGGA